MFLSCAGEEKGALIIYDTMMAGITYGMNTCFLFLGKKWV